MAQDYMLKRTVGLVVFIWVTFMVFTYLLSISLDYAFTMFQGQILLQSIIPLGIGAVLVFIWLFSWYKLTIHILHSGFQARKEQASQM